VSVAAQSPAQPRKELLLLVSTRSLDALSAAESFSASAHGSDLFIQLGAPPR
jgi:hypothetical protein